MDPKKFIEPIVKMVQGHVKEFEYSEDPKEDRKIRKVFLTSLRKELVDMLVAHEEALRAEIKVEGEKNLAKKRHERALKKKAQPPSNVSAGPKKPISPAALFANKIKAEIADKVNAETADPKEQETRIRAALNKAVAEYKKTPEFAKANSAYLKALAEIRGSSVSSTTSTKFNSEYGHVITAFLHKDEGWYRHLVNAGSRAGPLPKKPDSNRVTDEDHLLYGTPTRIAEFLQEAEGFDFLSLLKGGVHYQGDKKNIPAWLTHVPKGSNLKAAAAAATAAYAVKSAPEEPEEPEPKTPAPAAPKTRSKAKTPKAKTPKAAEPPASAEPAPAAPKTRSKAKAPAAAEPPVPVAAAAAEESDGDDGDEFESANDDSGADGDGDGDSDIEEEADDA
jgi:hypothetical protein